MVKHLSARMMAWARHRWPRRHDWEITCRNWAGYPTERRCRRCGTQQHLEGFQAIFENPWWFEHQRDGVDTAPWQDGPHPIAENMRRRGVSKNYGCGRRA